MSGFMFWYVVYTFPDDDSESCLDVFSPALLVGVGLASVARLSCDSCN